jgi:hypothetical protein
LAAARFTHPAALRRSLNPLDFSAATPDCWATEPANLAERLDPAPSLLQSEQAYESPTALFIQYGDQTVNRAVFFGRDTAWMPTTTGTTTFVF